MYATLIVENTYYCESEILLSSTVCIEYTSYILFYYLCISQAKKEQIRKSFCSEGMSSSESAGKTCLHLGVKFSPYNLFLLESAVFATCRFVDSELNKIFFKKEQEYRVR